MPEDIQKKDAHFDYGIPGQPIFIDLMIKIMLCRVYANVMDRKLVTAEKILGHAELLIQQVMDGQHLEIVTCPEMRQESRPYHIDILRKKFFLQKGVLMFSLK